jgi:DMSO/TMAO reductase YedYZ molybdopterin-dependent catalytic subunit
MLIIKRISDIRSSEITDKEVYLQRRRFLRTAAFATTAGLVAPSLLMPVSTRAGEKLAGVRKSAYRVDENLTAYEHITTYNNFYEFGSDKRSPAKLAHTLKTRPWTITVEGEVDKPGVYDVDDFIKPHTLEERVYRLRCVEAWSMVIPWAGFPLADVIKRFEPNSRAKYVQFVTLHDPEQMPGQKPGLDESVDSTCGRSLRRGAAQSKRRAAAPGNPVEVWLQEYQVHRKDAFRGKTARHDLEHGRTVRVWVLLERQSECRPPAMESEVGTAYRRGFVVLAEA